VGSLRRLRQQEHGDEFLVVSAVDPLNLVGTTTPDERVPSLAANRVLYCGGVALATRGPLSARTGWVARLVIAGQYP